MLQEPTTGEAPTVRRDSKKLFRIRSLSNRSPSRAGAAARAGREHDTVHAFTTTRFLLPCLVVPPPTAPAPVAPGARQRLGGACRGPRLRASAEEGGSTGA